MNFTRLDDGQRAELWACLALANLRGLGAVHRKKLVDFFGSPYKAVCSAEQWDNSGPELGINPAMVRHYMRGLWRDKAREQWDIIQQSECGILLYSDEGYPELLKETADAPLVLFYLGDLSLLRNSAVAVVGARNCTGEGMSVAVNIARGLTHAGITVVSGLAKGIDRVVHLAGLEGVGKSIAVLGCGVDVPYPKGNLDLYDLMAKKGLIISEFLPGTEPMAHNFPIRNRIISGLSRGVLVVEAAMRSGTLITARHAAEQNREVFAVPGSTVAETSEGCRDLIRRGAKAVFSAEDILRELAPIFEAEVELGRRSLNYTVVKPVAKNELQSPGILPWRNTPDATNAPGKQQPDALKAPLPEKMLAAACAGLAPDESAVLKLLNERENCHIDTISNALRLDIGKLSGLLAVLEVKGLIKRHPGMLYSL